jgi:molybdenum cofactor biosynthesis enzyme MoaA
MRSAEATVTLRLSHHVELRDTLEAQRRLRIAVTEACNLRCFFCHGDGGEVRHFTQGPSQLRVADLERLIEPAAGAGIRKIKISGGEPLLYSHQAENVVDLVRHASFAAERFGVEMSLVSNGTVLTRDLANRLRDAGLRRITISLHASTAQTFRRYAAPQDPRMFHSVLRGIENAVASGFSPVKINTVIYSSKKDESLRNARQMKRIVRLAAALGVSEVKFFVLIQNPRMAPSKHEDAFIYWDDPMFAEIYPAELVKPIADILRQEHNLGAASLRATFTVYSGDARLPELSFQNLLPKRGIHGQQACSCQEGTYALRLTSTGVLKACLWDKGDLNVIPALRTGRLDTVIEILRAAQSRLHVAEPYHVITSYVAA